MKTTLKHFLSRFGFLPAIDFVRRIPECISWANNGLSGIAPSPIKRLILKSYLTKYNLSCFVETGTHLGDTLGYISSDSNILCTSVELDRHLFCIAQSRFQYSKNVRLFLGDSSVIMKDIIYSLTKPALFWLDGHYSGITTACGSLETPISSELSFIFSSPINGHVILIDDIRCFDGTHDYPLLENLIEFIRLDGRYSMEISADILRLTPLVP